MNDIDLMFTASQYLSKPLPRETDAFARILPAFHKRIQDPEDVQTLIYSAIIYPHFSF